MFKSSLFVIFLMVAAGIPTFGQGQLADKIIGIVGQNIILQSDVEQQFAYNKRSNPGLADSTKCDIMYNLLAQQILIEQAKRDSVIVTDEEVNDILDRRIRYMIQQAGSKERLEAASGRTIYQLKEDYRSFFRDRTTAERMQQQIMENVHITPSEVKAFFEKIPEDSLPLMPATVEMGQIVIQPDVAPEIEALAKEKLEGIRKEIVEGGKSFSTMAAIYSMDEASRNNGGLIEINRTDFDPQFVAAAFRLQPGEVSPVIQSKFGYHIIKMERRQGDEATVRHILIIPEVTSVGLERTLKKLDSIRADLISGKITFSEAVGKYSTDEQSKMTGGMIYDNAGHSTLRIDQLQDPAVARAVSELKVGEYSKPAVFMNPATHSRACRILYLKSRTDPHRLNLTDDYNNIQSVALAQKKTEYLRDWIAERVGNYYIEIDPEYRDCSELKGWDSSVRKGQAGK